MISHGKKGSGLELEISEISDIDRNSLDSTKIRNFFPEMSFSF